MLLHDGLDKGEHCPDVEAPVSFLTRRHGSLNAALAQEWTEPLDVTGQDPGHPLYLLESIVQVSHVAPLQESNC